MEHKVLVAGKWVEAGELVPESPREARDVADLLNCGSRFRFTVCGESAPLIVSNCRDRGHLEFINKADKCDKYFCGEQWLQSDLGFKTFKKLAESQKKPRTIGAAASSKTGLPAVIERNQQVSRPASFSTKNKITNEDIAALVSDEVASDEEMLSYTTPRTKKLNPSKIFEGARNVATKVKNPNIATQGPPTVKVTFELDGFGTIETCYHKVVQGDDGVSLVLVYDNSYIGGTKFFPPSSDNDLYVDVHNMNQVFKVKSTGMHYRVDNQEHYILLIEQAQLKDEEE
jgi:hypothetical protein